MPGHDYRHGILCALGAGLLWGLDFIAPLALADYPPVLLALGRYFAFGLLSLPLGWRARHQLARLDRRAWWQALEFALSGFLLYYVLLSAAIQRAGAPLPSLIVGLLPLSVAVISNLQDRRLAWRRLAPALFAIALGIALVNRSELASLPAGHLGDYLEGGILALAALACWTAYAVRNAGWLKSRQDLSPALWANAVGLVLLPLSLSGFVLAGNMTAAGFAYPLGPDPLRYIGVMLLIGVCASWLGSLLWNRASRLLPTALTGQLIVFETLAAFAYAFLWRAALPQIEVLAGIALLVIGVLLGVHACRAAAAHA